MITKQIMKKRYVLWNLELIFQIIVYIKIKNKTRTFKHLEKSKLIFVKSILYEKKYNDWTISKKRIQNILQKKKDFEHHMNR